MASDTGRPARPASAMTGPASTSDRTAGRSVTSGASTER